MPLYKKILLTLSLFLCAYPSFAIEVAGVKIAESIQVSDAKLVLNGSGIRSKFFFDIYIGSLYCKTKANSFQEVINQGGPYRVSMHFLYDEISAEKLNSAWKEGFENNLSTDERKNLQPAISAFYLLFKTVHKGDVIDIDVSRNMTDVYLNGKKQGQVAHVDFHHALLQIWLGEEPADESLKEALLGK